MKFSLIYQGDLSPRANASKKWQIRRQFEPQLRRLWFTPPLEDMAKYQDPTHLPDDCYVGRSVGQIEYVPLITDRLSVRAEIEILLFSSDLPGGVVRHGDIDNRLKTLFDALSVPTPQQGTADVVQEDVESDGRVFCLLDDDRLITHVSVRTERLLSAQMGSTDALVVINVLPVAARATWSNITLTS